MKINGTGITPKITQINRERRSPQRQAPQHEPAVKVSISSEGNFISKLRTEALASGGIRHDLVAEVRAQLANGTFEASIDMDKVINGLMEDL